MLLTKLMIENTLSTACQPLLKEVFGTVLGRSFPYFISMVAVRKVPACSVTDGKSVAFYHAIKVSILDRQVCDAESSICFILRRPYVISAENVLSRRGPSFSP